MHLHLDPVGGIAGDMFLAAVLDAWPELASGLFAAVRAGGLPAAATVDVVRHKDHALTGSRFRVAMPEPAGHDDHHPSHHHHHHHHDHPHTPFRVIRERLESSSLAPDVRRRAIAIFTLLAEAEGAVHGVEPEEVELHEVGAWDSIADVVGAAFVIDALGAASWSIGPLPLGSGRVASAHGPLPVPAPATVRLLEGFAVHDDGIPGERVTPTGAAIVRHLAPSAGPPREPRRLERSGTGFGTRSLGDLSNVLRLLAFGEPETAALSAGAWETGEVAEIAFDVDDQTAEDLAVGLDRLRAVAGVLDVGQAPVFGKRGRLATQVRLLARPERLDAAIEACFAETATIGLRWHLVRRATLARHSETWREDGREVRVRRVERPAGPATVKAEMADLAGEEGGRVARERLRRAAEAGALEREEPAAAEEGEER